MGRVHQPFTVLFSVVLLRDFRIVNSNMMGSLTTEEVAGTSMEPSVYALRSQELYRAFKRAYVERVGERNTNDSDPKILVGMKFPS